ncbi:MAG TPA: hypothetical protein VJA21_02070 [Verrucomicrobiae bacterium]
MNHPELDMLQRFRGKPFAVQLFGGDIHTGRLLGVWLDADGRMMLRLRKATGETIRIKWGAVKLWGETVPPSS